VASRSPAAKPNTSPPRSVAPNLDSGSTATPWRAHSAATVRPTRRAFRNLAAGNRGEFYDQEQFKGRAILVRYVWSNISPHAARMEQSFSADGGKNWEVNWICELSR